MIPDHKHVELYTFGIGYSHFGDPVEYEEIDIWASSQAEASKLAKITADEGYQPGYVEIVGLPPGGSGGLFQIWSA
jgi:hypothetical protein